MKIRPVEAELFHSDGQTDITKLSLYLVDRASFSNSSLFLYQLDTLSFLYNLCLFVSTCFGPIGPSSGGSNA